MNFFAMIALALALVPTPEGALRLERTTALQRSAERVWPEPSRANADRSQQKFQVSGEPMFNQSCRFIGYRGIGVELTARKWRQAPGDRDVDSS